MDKLNWINGLSKDDAEREFHRCCGSLAWAKAMALARPYSSQEAVVRHADAAWDSLSDAQKNEVFQHHPRIGSLENLKARFGETGAWSLEEQRNVRAASEGILTRLHQRNLEYEKKFGFIFLVCATGKSAEALLSDLEFRLKNSRTQEISIAMREQAKITRLRLEKLLTQ